MKNMIDKLKFLIDRCENNPKFKSILLKVAAMPEDKQEDTLKLIEILTMSETPKWLMARWTQQGRIKLSFTKNEAIVVVGNKILDCRETKVIGLFLVHAKTQTNEVRALMLTHLC